LNLIILISFKGGKMQKKIWIILALLLVIPGLLFTASCAKTVVKSEPAVTQASEEDEAVIRAAEKARQQASEMMREKRVARNMFINEDIYFDFDKSNILLLAQDVLRRKAEWLWSNPEVSVIIEGHCDERGTNEYNLALGDRRAESARNFLVDLGIKGSRLTTISYGEERPVDSGHNEEAWAKNRCAHFIIE
jgi:peptidoglycan-associated lipoprotein